MHGEDFLIGMGQCILLPHLSFMERTLSYWHGAVHSSAASRQARDHFEQARALLQFTSGLRGSRGHSLAPVSLEPLQLLAHFDSQRQFSLSRQAAQNLAAKKKQRPPLNLSLCRQAGRGALGNESKRKEAARLREAPPKLCRKSTRAK